MSTLKKKGKMEKENEVDDYARGDSTEKENPTDIGPGITERYNDA